MVHYKECPVCGSASIQQMLTVTDHSCSKEQFSVWNCGSCSFAFTQDVPAQEEIGRYYQFENYVSHTDTKKGLVNRLYHWVRNYTLKGKQRIIQKATGLKNGHILDIGCGTGAFLNRMQQNGWQVTGLEPDKTARDVAMQQYQVAARLPEELFQLPVNSFDAITMWHVLEHVHQLKEYIQQIHRLLKPGGTLVIAVPNYTAHDARVYKEFWAAWDVPRHLYHFSPNAMEHLLQQGKFGVQRMLPMWFDSVYVSMLSEKYRKGNIVRAVFTGMISNIKALFNRRKCSSIIYLAKRS